MKRVLWAAMILIGAVASANAEIAIMGAGTSTCGKFANVYKTSPNMAEWEFFSWGQGLMSAFNMMAVSRGENIRDLGAISVSGQERIVREYCDEHPLADYMDAIRFLYLKLPLTPFKN